MPLARPTAAHDSCDHRYFPATPRPSRRDAPPRQEARVSPSLAVPLRALILVLACAATGMIGGLAGGHVQALARVDDTLAAHSARLLYRAEQVAGESKQLLALVQQQTRGCSADDMTRLREFLFRATYLRDLGRLEQGGIACTAAWGPLATTLPLPPDPLSLPTGTRLWSHRPNPIEPKLMGDIASHGDAVVFTAPSAFDGFPEPGANIHAKVLTRDGNHTFQQFGDASLLQLPASPDAPPRGRAGHRVHAACTQAPRSNICVLSSTLLPALSETGTVLLAGFGTLGGGLVGGAVLFWRAQWSSRKAALRRALRQDGLAVHYQPLRRLATNELVGFEVLARWTDPQGVPVSPAEFVPLAESIGLGRTLARQVATRALTEAGSLLQGPGHLYLSLNVDPADVVDPAYRRLLSALLRQFDIAPARIALEVTEGNTADDAAVAAQLRALKAQGFRIFIDDFGTGHSNLNYLADLQPDVIKLDKRFTQGARTDPVSALIVGHVVDIVRTLDIAMVAEGIETEEQRQHVLSLHPGAIGQGWLLGRPAPLAGMPSA
jgi:sensor c-di-GMP phosphodiesterase-like protein